VAEAEQPLRQVDIVPAQPNQLAHGEAVAARKKNHGRIPHPMAAKSRLRRHDEPLHLCRKEMLARA
jgi:hypothetical protein